MGGATVAIAGGQVGLHTLLVERGKLAGGAIDHLLLAVFITQEQAKVFRVRI